MTKIKEIQAKSLLNANKHPNQWFGVRYYANLYRGCPHRCIYCDSRSECYGVEDFDGQLEVKVNAIGLLRQETGSQAPFGYYWLRCYVRPLRAAGIGL